MTDLATEIAKARESAQVSDCFCCAGLLVPRLLAALELAIEQRDELSEELEGNTFALEFCKREDNAAILAALEGRDG